MEGAGVVQAEEGVAEDAGGPDHDGGSVAAHVREWKGGQQAGGVDGHHADGAISPNKALEEKKNH